jgi:hypothetical protein
MLEKKEKTFTRRNTLLPEQTPFGLTAGFTEDTQKKMQWQAFLRKNRLNAPSLVEIIYTLIEFLMPVVTVNSAPSYWQPTGPWAL